MEAADLINICAEMDAAEAYQRNLGESAAKSK
jgi:hypothetical protein